jgi:NTP pyrophosphatase (non-canonical NTP hydrolase)
MAVYSEKYSIQTSDDYYLLKIQEELGELSSAYLKLTQRARAKQATAEELEKNLREEVADVIAMTILFAKGRGIDVQSALEEKWFKYL